MTDDPSGSARDTMAPRPPSDAEPAATAPTATTPHSSRRVPDRLTRFLAYLVDALLVAAVASVPVVGGLAATVYVLVRDGLDIDVMRHRSLGKVVMKLAVVRDDGAPMDVATSFRRNWPLAFASLSVLLLFIPILGWFLIPFVILAGLVLVIVEIVKVLTAPDGRRWGDELAGTRVVFADEAT
jgi:uncharacterized RDD family membrane protein YckC